ncbi:MAG: LPS assembly lipoprotein LptE [Pseudomonadota bacterium]
MWSSDRRSFLALSAFAASSACGFTPVYGPGGSAEGLRGRILVAPPRDQFGFDLVEQLEIRLGEPSAADFRLEAEIAVTDERLGITEGEEATRITLLGRVRYSLRATGTGAVVTSGEVQNFTSYSTTDTPFATQAAQEDANKRLMVILADEIVSRLLITSESWLT